MQKQWMEMDQNEKLNDLNDRIKKIDAHIAKYDYSFRSAIAMLNTRMDALTKPAE
jgi:hypothetical protein